jgi:hypothetical protein
MNLTPNDISGYDNKLKEEDNKEEEDEEINVEDAENYNPNWTLRKCCSKFIDRLSHVYPKQVLDIIKPHLEENMQNNNWNVK